MNSQVIKKVFIKTAFNRFFIPSLLSSLGLAVGALADCFFVGSQIGADGLAVIGFGAPIYALFSLISIGISTGTSIHYSMELGKGNEKKGQEIFLNTLFFVFGIILFLAILGNLFLPQVLWALGATSKSAVYPLACQYVRAQLILTPIMFMQAPFYYFVHCDNNPKLAAFALVSANVLDIILNYLFLVVLKIGIVGAVYSTALAAIVTISLCLTHVFSKKTVLKFGRFHLTFKYIISGIMTGYATNAQYAYQFCVTLVFNQLLMKLAGESGVAYLDVATSIIALVIAVIEGTGLTLQPMVSTFFGERNARNIKSTLLYSFLAGGSLCIGLSFAIGIVTPNLCQMFGLAKSDTLEGSVWAIRALLLSIPVKFIVAEMSCYYQTVTKERLAYALIFISDAFGRIFFGILFAGFGIRLFWFCYIFSELLALLALALYCSRKKTVLFLDFKEAVFTTLLQKGSNENSLIMEQIQEFCMEHGASAKQSYFLTMTVEEVCTSVFKKDMVKKTYIQLTVVCEGQDEYTLHLRDNYDAAFNPFDTQTSKLEEATDENVIGMKMVKSKAKDFYYRQYSGFNTLVVKI